MTTGSALATPYDSEGRRKVVSSELVFLGNEVKKRNRGSRSTSYDAKSARDPRYRRKGIRR